MTGNILAVAFGGALGSVARYLMVQGLGLHAPAAFPWGTLSVNVLGGLAIGLIAGIFSLHVALPAELRLFLITGILGGFTTFSAFSLDVVQVMARGAWFEAFAYVCASVIGSVGCTIIGLRLVRWLAV